MPEQFTHRAICNLRERVQVIKDHFVSQMLASNPLDDPAERDLLVYLPPGYERSPGQRYPVVFALAGYSESDASLQNWLPFQPTLSGSAGSTHGAGAARGGPHRRDAGLLHGLRRQPVPQFAGGRQL